MDVMERARRPFERAGVPLEIETPREGEHRLIFSALPRPDSLKEPRTEGASPM